MAERSRSSEARIHVKASNLIGQVRSLRTRGLLERVLHEVPPDTAALLRTPPPVSTWVDADHFIALNEAVFRVGGESATREVGHEAVTANVLPVLQVILQGIFRLFGASPASVFSRIGMMLASTLRGVTLEFELEAPGAKSGRLKAFTPPKHPLPHSVALSMCGSFEVVFDVCKARGSVTPVASHPWGLEFAARWE